MPSLLIALLLAAFAAAGCGGGGNGGGGDAAGASPTELLNTTFGGDTSIRSGRLTLALDADVQGVAKPVTFKLSGPFETSESKTELPKFSFELAVTSGGATQRIGATSTGDKGFLSYKGVDYAVPDDLFKQFADGYRQSAQQGAKQGSAPSLTSLGIDPLKWLTDPRRAGETDVGGVRTVHLTAGIDVPKLLGDVRTAAGKVGSASSQAQQLSQADVQQLAKSVKSAKVDIYTGADDRKLRKFVLDLQLATGHVALTLQFDELNQPQDVTAPADAKSITGLLSALGAGATSGSGSATPPSTTAPSGSSNQRYLDCVQAAGNDIAQVQACAKYL
ncbi:hypothetical protein DSM104329_04387 [Capillimicrobium parvum]|uniref:LppX_LprAFG lipoprotein n=1 Tax=Capillimicrobium parvum TaxID=2884022 RepID=A0A9E7C1X9_9ACTN|nr:hypothetical protein DSM104329_04387 [Capillimicrobium parvum]